MWVAPGLVALAAVPEFIQHIVEIRLGMFDSLTAARALANDPTRWAFGYVKLAGFALAILALTRLWAVGGSARRAVLVPPAVLAKAAGVLGLLIGTGGLLEVAARQIGGVSAGAVQVVSAVLQAGFSVWLVGTLVEDRTSSARLAFTDRLPTALVQIALLAAAFVPAQLLHGFDHHLALGRPEPVVWALMTFDALVVGLLAALVGAAFFVSYDLGATWCGWRGR